MATDTSCIRFVLCCIYSYHYKIIVPFSAIDITDGKDFTNNDDDDNDDDDNNVKSKSLQHMDCGQSITGG